MEHTYNTISNVFEGWASKFKIIAAAVMALGLTFALTAPAGAITSKITSSTTAKTLVITGEGYTSTVPVTVTCATETTVNISVVLRQEQGTDQFGFPAVTNAYGSELVACGPTPTTYQIPVQVPYGGLPLQPGRASLTVDVANCDPNTSECTYARTLTRQVKLTY